jgi:phosphoadenosine phosphosulfate reductase
MAKDDKRHKATLKVLRDARVCGPIAFSTSLSAEDMVLTDLIARRKLDIDVFTLDTLMLPSETLTLLEQVRARYGLDIKVMKPRDQDVQNLVGQYGTYGFYESLEARKACCHVRKVAPLNIALDGYAGWVTGLRRAQASSRKDLAEIEEPSRAGDLIKYNPLAAWSWQDVLDYIDDYDVPISALYGRGYVSIGCAPCTRALKPGEDPRAARWWWEMDGGQKECGLHVKEAVA